ncbi:MAG: HEAT repeat domain-containing protein [Pirellulales bacterium]|nr:HEAT repeat domain-containing protein [Pirellulales bacterium]
MQAPCERIAELKELAKKGSSGDSASQQQVAARLAQGFENEGDPLIRAEIVRTLGAYRCQQAEDVLRAALEDLDPEVRMTACEAWGKRDGPQSAALLGRTLGGDVDIDVRLAAARALGRSKDPSAVAALGEVLGDEDPAMQVRAMKSLRQITGKDLGNDVNRWQQYVGGETPEPARSLSIAERLRQMFY